MSEVACIGEGAASISSGRTVSANRVFALALGAFLIVTAWLKAVSPAESAVLEAAYDLPHWLVILAVQLEFLVAFLLLSGVWPRGAWASALALFSIFAAFSLYRALAGYETCGCFGSFSVNPWWTFTIDVAIVAILIGQRRPFLERQGSSPSSAKLVSTACIVLGLGIVSLYWMLSAGRAAVGDSGALFGGQGLVILEPDEWIGKEFPLGDFISPTVDLSQGKWVVLFYHHDCQKCQDALPEYEAMAATMARGGDASQVLLLEVPPYGASTGGRGRAAYARLSDSREWFVQAPVEIRLRNGKVEGASLDLPSLAMIH